MAESTPEPVRIRCDVCSSLVPREEWHDHMTDHGYDWEVHNKLKGMAASIRKMLSGSTSDESPSDIREATPSDNTESTPNDSKESAPTDITKSTEPIDLGEAIKRDEGLRQRCIDIGKKVVAVVDNKDGGPVRMRQAQAARKQLETFVRMWNNSARVFPFGSAISYGVWDGKADLDLTAVDPAMAASGAWSKKVDERTAVREIGQHLLKSGFHRKQMQRVQMARVPVIKSKPDRKSLADEAAMRRRPQLPPTLSERTIQCFFDDRVAPTERAVLVDKLASVIDNPIEEVMWDRPGRVLMLTLASTTDAVRALVVIRVLCRERRLKINVVRPVHPQYVPEIYQVDFDLSFRVFGLRNSYLLRRCLGKSPTARAGALVLKDWSKACGINDSSRGFLTSYAVNIMWVYFLFRKGYIPYVDPEDIKVDYNSATAGLEYEALVPPDVLRQVEAGAAADSEATSFFTLLGQQLLDFFVFYTTEFNWDEHVISLNSSSVKTKAEMDWTMEAATADKNIKNICICIEDPYEHNLNLGRHQGICRASRVLIELRRALASLFKDDVNNAVLFPMADKASRNRPTEEFALPGASSGKGLNRPMDRTMEEEICDDDDAPEKDGENIPDEERRLPASLDGILTDKLLSHIRKRVQEDIRLVELYGLAEFLKRNDAVVYNAVVMSKMPWQTLAYRIGYNLRSITHASGLVTWHMSKIPTNEIPGVDYNDVSDLRHNPSVNRLLASVEAGGTVAPLPNPLQPSEAETPMYTKVSAMRQQAWWNGVAAPLAHQDVNPSPGCNMTHLQPSNYNARTYVGLRRAGQRLVRQLPLMRL